MRSIHPVLGVTLGLLALSVPPLLATPALAQDERPECRCRADGRAYELGQTATLRLPGGLTCVRCVMSSNVPSWQPLADGCPTASLPPEPAANPRG